MSKENNKSKTALFIAAYVGVFLTLAFCGYFSARQLSTMDAMKPAQQEFTTDLTYYDMPRMSLAIQGPNSMVHVQVDITLEVPKKDLMIVSGYEPRMFDKLNAYFATLDPSHLTHAGDLPWLRDEILRQINSAGSPAPVHDLFLRHMTVM